MPQRSTFEPSTHHPVVAGASKRSKYDSLKMSSNSSVKDQKIENKLSHQWFTQKPSTALDWNSRNYEISSNQIESAQSSNDNLYNKTVHSLKELKKITSGDTGSSNFQENKCTQLF